MSLFNSQTIFSILFTILVGFIIYYFTSYKHRMLEYTVKEQAKLLQSVIMSMNTNNHNIMNIVQKRNNAEHMIKVIRILKIVCEWNSDIFYFYT